MRYESIAAILLALLGCCTSAQAEHRSAVVVGDDSDRLQGVAAGLQEFGFECRLVTSPDQRSLKSALESFADGTPTQGTALVCFQGRYTTAKDRGKPSKTLLSSGNTNGRDC